jgi:hypothetical protein
VCGKNLSDIYYPRHLRTVHGELHVNDPDEPILEEPREFHVSLPKVSPAIACAVEDCIGILHS